MRVDSLLLTVVVGVTAFAVADLVFARADPSQFVGLETTTDALYFALTMLTAVGFGDIHVEGQPARLLVIAHRGLPGARDAARARRGWRLSLPRLGDAKVCP